MAIGDRVILGLEGRHERLAVTIRFHEPRSRYSCERRQNLVAHGERGRRTTDLQGEGLNSGR
jgi:hypothetical protein